MLCKKIFARVLMTLCIFSIMVFVVGCGNETAANSKAAEKSLSAADSSSAAKKIQEGLNLFNSLDYKGAISLLDEISALKLKTIAEYNLRGEYFVKVGEYHYDTKNYDKGQELFDLAIKDYSSAIKLNPKDIESYLNRGNFYCTHGDQDLAIEDYNKVIELDPNNVDAYIGRGNAYNHTGHLAQRDLHTAVQLNPNDFKAYMARSVIYLSVGQQNLALADANKAVELNPEEPEVYNNRGNIYFELKQYDSALQDYDKAIELDPKNYKAYKGRGVVYSARREYDRAMEELDKCIEIYPELNAVNLRNHCYYLSLKERNGNSE